MILVMLFSLRHQLSGQALIDLVKVLRALLPDSHKFVSSAYLLKKYFADFLENLHQRSTLTVGTVLGEYERVKQNA